MVIKVHIFKSSTDLVPMKALPYCRIWIMDNYGLSLSDCPNLVLQIGSNHRRCKWAEWLSDVLLTLEIFLGSTYRKAAEILSKIVGTF